MNSKQNNKKCFVRFHYPQLGVTCLLTRSFCTQDDPVVLPLAVPSKILIILNIYFFLDEKIKVILY